MDGELVTRSGVAVAPVDGDAVVPDVRHDVLKLVVVNRYEEAPPAVAFVRGFGLREGALASSVAHDCHNLVAVGVNDESISEAMNLLMDHRGGLAAVGGDVTEVLPLPVAGLMSLGDCSTVASTYKKLNAMAIRMGTSLTAPFMTLSFMALLVIPSLKLSDQGLFDGDRFEPVSLFAD